MKTDFQNVAGLMACAICADGQYDEAEKDTIGEIADALEYNEIQFNIAVDNAVKKVQKMTDEEVDTYLSDCASKVIDKEIGMTFEAAMQIILCDGVMTLSEAELIHEMGAALGISPAMVTMLLADMVKHEPELELDFGTDDAEQ